ncbi:MAG: CAP domain-containing protein [Bacteroidales bacterium]|nr:CAP domain-containing protein [Bacteroidales bacterium]MBN2750777.1 CAP domain-containing protein [Bacteroidales bacterium]
MRTPIKLIALLALLTLGTQTFAQQLTKESEAQIVEEIVVLVNRHRTKLGLDTLTHEPFVSEVSKEHSKNMAKGKVGFSHDGFENRAKRIIKEFGGSGFAENIAFGQPTAQQVTEGWLKSPGHKANIEGDFTHIGVGLYADKKGTIYYTQIFVKK